MLALTVVEEIVRLLQEGTLSQRKIAARLRVSRGTVNAIANGHRGLYGRDPTTAAAVPGVPSLPPERCPRCGFSVYVPCLVCRAREYRDSRRLQRELAMFRRRAMAQVSRRGVLRRGRRVRRSRVA